MEQSPTRQWLEQIYGQSPGYFTVIVFKDGRPASTKSFSTSELDKVAPAIEKAAEKHDVYTSVATYKKPPTGGRRGSLPDVLSIPGWWADIDIGEEGHKPASQPNPRSVEEALTIIDGMPEPSAVIHSGGGLQVWWLFDEPWVFNDPKEAQRASNEWQALLKSKADELGLHLDTLGDLPRILRVPGTNNHKTENVRPVKMLEQRETRYPATELTSLGESSEPELAVPRGFQTWESILEPHGWTKAGTRPTDGATLWVRPGKDISEGHSAVTDPYGVPVLVNFSGTSGLPVGPGHRLTKFKVWAYLNYSGDFDKAKAALEQMTVNDPALLAEHAARFIPLDWDDVFSGADEPVDWIVEPLLEAGRQVAFYSEAKAGKSLLWLELAARIASGKTAFTELVQPVDPRTVVYIDLENTVRDIGERLQKMGFQPDELKQNLFYYSFPSIGYLDTKAGALDVLSLAVVHNADVVIIDTLSRVVEGDENENDTFNNFYKFTGVSLKAQGISLVRLDHSGKDVARGMRGASSKTTDVDEIWQLRIDDADDNLVYLKRTHTRSAHGADHVTLRRRDDPVLHHSTDITTIDELGVKDGD